MTPEQFLQVAQALPEAALLVGEGGEILAANRAAGALGFHASGEGFPKLTGLAANAQQFDDYLQLAARSREPIPGTFGLCTAGSERPFRLYASLLCPGGARGEASGNALLMVRLMPEETAASGLDALNDKIAALKAEVRGHQATEQQLRRADERHRAIEEHLSALVQASNTLTETLDAEEVLAAILRLAGRLLAADAYAIWRYSVESGQWSIAAADGLSETYRKSAIQMLHEMAAMRAEPVAVDDVFALPALSERRSIYESEGIRSLLVAPLRIRGSVCGTLAFYHRRPRSFTSAEVGLGMAVANLAAASLSSADLYLEQARLRAEAQTREQWLRVTLASIADAVVTIDVHGRIRFLNPAAEALTGWPLIEARGRDLDEILPIIDEETREPMESPCRRVLREGVPVGPDNRSVLVARCGRQIPIDDSAAPIRDAAGRVAGVVLIVRDASERKRAQASLRHLAAIVESSDDAIVGKSLDGIITSWNAGAERLCGYSAAEVIGQPFSVLVPAERAGEVEESILRLRRGERLHHYETVRRRSDGSLVEVSMSYSPIHDESGRLIGVSAIARDISDAKRLERALRESEERFRGLMEQSPLSVQIFSSNGWTMRVNRAWSELWGVTIEQMADYNVLHDRQLEAKGVLPYIRRAFAGEAVHIPPIEYDPEQSLPNRSRHADSKRWVAAVAYPLKDDDGRVRQVVLVHEDMTARMRAETALLESEEKFRLMADTIPQLAWMARPDGHIFWYNRRWYEYTGATPAEMEGWGWQRVHDPARLPEVLRRWNASLASGEPFSMVFPLRGADGRYRPFLTRINPLRSDEGELRLWFGTNTDVSEQKQAEENSRFLSDASATLAAIVDYKTTLQNVARLAVPSFADWCMVDMLDSSGALERVAVAHGDPSKVELAQELYHRFPPDKSAERGVWNIIRTRSSEIVSEITDDLLAASTSDRELLRVIRQLGPRSYIGVPLIARGKMLGVITFLAAESLRRYDADDLTLAEDLAHRAAVALENARLYAELKEADRRKDEFLATLAHELRNPLAPIRNSLQILKMPIADRELIDHARQIMERQLEHLVRLVDDLLDVSRVMRGKIDLRKERIDLVGVVAHALETVQPALDAQGHRIELALPDLPLVVEADAMRLAQVVGNLLANAAKYTPRGGRIWLSAETDDGRAVLRVRDSGIGIAPEALDRIFDLFVQADNSVARTQGGLGIGLTLVRSLLEMHGGKVAVTSAGLGQGSEFTVRLPLAAGPASATLHMPADAQAAAADRLPRRVLIVDDNIDAATTLAALLRLGGNEAKVTHDGAAALAAAREQRPDIVFLDIGMPGMDGYEVARRLRQEPALDGTLLVALTGWGQQDDRRRSAEAGFDVHLVKPLDMAALGGLFVHPKMTRQTLQQASLLSPSPSPQP